VATVYGEPFESEVNWASAVNIAAVEEIIRPALEADIPALRPGTAVIFEETFANVAGLDAAWTTKLNPTLVKGGVITGPRFKTLGTGAEYRFSACVPKHTEAERAAGYATPKAIVNLPASGFACLSLFVRPGARESIYSVYGAPLLFTEDASGNFNDFLSVEVVRDDEHRFRFRAGLIWSLQLSEYLPTGEWYHCWCALDIAAKKGQWFIRKMFDDQVIAFTPIVSNNATTKAILGRIETTNTAANVPWLNGQLSGFRIYSAQTFAQAQDEPIDYVLPPGGITVELSATGNDGNRVGPILTAQKMLDLVNGNVVMGSSRNYQTLAGSRADYEALATTANRKLFCGDFVNSKIKRNPQSDTIIIRKGLYRLPSHGVIAGPPIGIGIIGDAGSEIRIGTVLAGAWTAPDGAVPTCWLYGSVVSLTGIAYAPGRVCFTPIQAANLAEAKTRLTAKTYGCWVSSGGDLWVSLPSGITPASLSALTPAGSWEYCDGGWGSTTGAHIENVKLTGITKVIYNAGAGSRVENHYGLWSDQVCPVITIYNRCTAEGYSKHVFAFAGNKNEGACLFISPRFGGQVPIPDNVWDGANAGNFSSLVDFSSMDSVDGKLVSFYYDAQSSPVGYLASPGRATGSSWDSSQGQPFYGHDAGGGEQPFASCVAAFISAKPTGWVFPAAIADSHAEALIVEFYR